jgi:ABC-type phosphate/phosphonate transport system ATPase subunit
MAELIAVVGESGSGKTTSIRNLDPATTFIISTTGKRPGIRGAKKKYPDVKIDKENNTITGNFYTTSNIDNIVKMMKLVDKKRPEVKVLIVDD